MGKDRDGTIMNSFYRLKRSGSEGTRSIRDRTVHTRRTHSFGSRQGRFDAIHFTKRKWFLTSIFGDSATKEAVLFLLRHAFIYYCLSVFGFSFLLDDLSITNSLYLATVTFTTIGYGDVYPRGHGRMYLIVLASYGIVVIGIFLGALGDREAESQTAVSKERKRKLHRMVIETIASKRGMRTQDLPTFEPPAPLMNDVASIVVLEAPAILIILLIGALVGFYEGWTVLDSVYWTAISSYTIGFGDVAPKSSTARLICVLFLPVSVAVVRDVLGRISLLYRERKQVRRDEASFTKTLNRCDLRLLASNSGGRVTREDFVSFMLVALQIVAEEDLKELQNLFDSLDSSSAGALMMEDLPDNSIRLRAFRTKNVEQV